MTDIAKMKLKSYDYVEKPLTLEQKSEWIAALRSGEYVQGCGQLECIDDLDAGLTTYCYCCLGVLNSITKLGINPSKGFLANNNGSSHYALPESIQNILTKMNDGNTLENNRGSKSFEEIAEWIEQNVKAIDEFDSYKQRQAQHTVTIL